MSATPRDESGWTIETYSAYNEARRLDQERFEEERDRRYREVAEERDKALRIKEKADEQALLLARDIQTYKDEKANELREQIASERGTYLNRDEYLIQHQALEDKMDAALKPLVEFMSTQQGRSSGIGSSATVLYAALVLAASIITAVIIYSHHA